VVIPHRSFGTAVIPLFKIIRRLISQKREELFYFAAQALNHAVNPYPANV